MICPKCGDDLSSATKVCPRCGYVVDDNIDVYLMTLENLFNEVKSCRPVSFSEYFSKKAYLLYAFVTVIFIVVMFMTDAGLFLLLSAIAFLMTVISLVRKIALRKKNDESEGKYSQLLIEIDSCMRILKSDYSESSKVRDRLRVATSDLKDIVARHDENRRHAVKIWIIVFLVTAAVSAAGITVLGLRDMGNDTSLTQMIN